MAHLDLLTGYLILEWVGRIVMLAAVLRDQSSSAARSWLLFGFFLPLPALGLYLLVGRTRLPRLRRARLEALARLAAGQAPADIASTETGRLARRLGAEPERSGNEITLLADYEVAVERLLHDIGLARTRVLLVAYIFADDTTGRRVLDAVADAVGRGSTCHVLLDRLGSWRWRRTLVPKLKRAGCSVAYSNPISSARGGTGRIDRRNHRKLYVIDDRIAYVGSQNIVDRDFVRGITNYELLARCEGPIATDAARLAAADWFLNTGRMLAQPCQAEGVGSATAQLMASGEGGPPWTYQQLLLALIGRADTTLLIASPYTVLDDAVYLALCTAAARGVDVVLLISRVVDKPLVRLAQDGWIGPLLNANVRIAEFGQGLLHAKYVLVDERWTVIGSSNSDIRSFRINAEAGLVSEDKGLAAQLGQVARGHLAASRFLAGAEWAARSRMRQTLERVAGLASPLM